MKTPSKLLVVAVLLSGCAATAPSAEKARESQCLNVQSVAYRQIRPQLPQPPPQRDERFQTYKPALADLSPGERLTFRHQIDRIRTEIDKEVIRVTGKLDESFYREPSSQELFEHLCISTWCYAQLEAEQARAAEARLIVATVCFRAGNITKGRAFAKWGEFIRLYDQLATGPPLPSVPSRGDA